jgi:hypothetical protein
MASGKVAIDANKVRNIQNDYSRYSPLDPTKREIQIFILHPAKTRDDHLVCSLARTSLFHEAPQFETLSYCWGDLNTTKTITLNFEDKDITVSGNKLLNAGKQISFSNLEQRCDAGEPMRITETLHNGLLAFRHTEKHRILCINQENTDTGERSHQVRFM